MVSIRKEFVEQAESAIRQWVAVTQSPAQSLGAGQFLFAPPKFGPAILVWRWEQGIVMPNRAGTGQKRGGGQMAAPLAFATSIRLDVVLSSSGQKRMPPVITTWPVNVVA